MAEVCSGKVDGQVSMVDPLLSANGGEDIIPNVIGTTTNTEGKRELCGEGALGA